MDRNLLFLTLSFVAIWLLMDDFVGQKRISNMVTSITSGTTPALGGLGGAEPLTPSNPPTAGDPAPIPPNLATYPNLPTTPGAGGVQTQPSFLIPGAKPPIKV